MVETVHALTVRARTWQETTELVDKLNRALRGWANYFSVGCASKAFAEWSVYSATKAAVRSFARTWAADLKGRDIRINAVSPGVIDTPGYRLVGLDETRPSWPAFSAGPPTPPPSGGMEFPAMSQRWSASSPPTTVASSPEAKSSWMEGLPRSDLANQAPIHRRVFECRGDYVPPLRECPKTSPK
jgi:NAD(P)-dependent dehydrogenase (short-subunit alcohol dehydrogenase family)